MSIHGIFIVMINNMESWKEIKVKCFFFLSKYVE